MPGAREKGAGEDGSDAPCRSRSKNALGLPRSSSDEVVDLGFESCTSPRLTEPGGPSIVGQGMEARRVSGTEWRGRGLQGDALQSVGGCIAEEDEHCDCERYETARHEGTTSPQSSSADHDASLGRQMSGTFERPFMTGVPGMTRSLSEDSAQHLQMTTPRLGSFDTYAVGGLQSQDSWRPSISREDKFCEFTGTQVSKLEKLVHVLRSLAPDDEETCTILGNELFSMLEHRGVRADVEAVLRILDETANVEIES